MGACCAILSVSAPQLPVSGKDKEASQAGLPFVAAFPLLETYLPCYILIRVGDSRSVGTEHFPILVACCAGVPPAGTSGPILYFCQGRGVSDAVGKRVFPLTAYF